MSLNFSFIYKVTVEKYRREALYDQQEINYETDIEEILVLAEDLEDAIAKAHDYVQELIPESTWEFYDITDARRIVEVFTGVEISAHQEEIEYTTVSQPDGYSEGK